MRGSLFALGAERSAGTSEIVDELVVHPRPEERIAILRDGRDDLSTLQSFAELASPLAELSPLADGALARSKELMKA